MLWLNTYWSCKVYAHMFEKRTPGPGISIETRDARDKIRQTYLHQRLQFNALDNPQAGIQLLVVYFIIIFK